jgi:hypothetical protein
MEHPIKSYFINGILLFCLSLSVACSSNKKQQKKNTKAVTEADSSTVKPVKNKLAPGTIDITARIIMYNETNPYRVTLKVLTVNGYGSSTPMISSSSELKVTISKALLNDHKLEDIKKEFTSVKPIRLILKSQQEMAMGQQSGPNWTVINYL